MPLLKLETNAAFMDAQRLQLLAPLSKIVSETIGKPEQYVMVTIQEAAMTMAGRPGDAAFVEVRSIGGLTGEVNQTLSKRICALLTQSIRVQPERVYLNFSDVPAEDW